MPPVIAHPPKGAFHLPAVLHDVPPIAGVLDHCQGSLVRLLQAADPVAQPLRLLASIDPDLPEAGDTGGQIALHQCDPAKPRLSLSSSHDYRHQQPQGLDQERPLAPFDPKLPQATNQQLFVT